MPEPEVLIFPTAEILAVATAQRIADVATAAASTHGTCLLALCGGSLPPHVYRLLAAPPLYSQMPWGSLSVIWADERYVPLDHSDSNYLLARQTLLDHVPIPSGQIFPVPTNQPIVAQAADVYTHQLRALLDRHAGRIDIVLLGMGPDGHIASLFPGYPALDAAQDQLAIAVTDAPKPPLTRISLTPAALNHAANVIFLVAGADKATKVRAALRDPYNPHTNPAQIVRPPTGQVTWMLDAAAAADLT